MYGFSDNAPTHHHMLSTYNNPIHHSVTQYNPQGWSDYHGYSTNPSQFSCDARNSDWRCDTQSHQQECYQQYTNKSTLRHEYRNQDSNELSRGWGGETQSYCYPMSEVRQGPDEWYYHDLHSRRSRSTYTTNQSDSNIYASSTNSKIDHSYDEGVSNYGSYQLCSGKNI